MAKTTTVHRSGSSGRFVDQKYAEKHPRTTVKESIPLPGHRDTRDSSTGKFLSQEPVTKRGTISDADARRAVDVYRSGKK